MAGPVLLVELPTENTTRPEAAALVRACSEALGSGRCELSSSTTTADGVAIVSLSNRDGLSALVEVGSLRSQSRPWRSQELTFKPQDERIERFRTLGLAIATLYKEARLTEAAPESRSETEAKTARATPQAGAAAETKPKLRRDSKSQRTAAETKPSAQREGESKNEGDYKSDYEGDYEGDTVVPAAPPPRRGSGRTPRAWITAGALSAYDHELSSAFRFGGQGSLAFAPTELPIFTILSGSYAVGRLSSDALPSPLSLSWATLATGIGGSLPLARNVDFRISVQGVLVRLEAHGSDPERGEEDSQRWLPGGQAGVELVGWSSQRWGVAFGPTIQQLAGRTAITVRGQPLAKVAAFSFQLGASLELRLFQGK